MRQIIALALVPIIATTPALSAPGVTTTSVNFRSGPGANFSSIRTLPAGTALEIGDCLVHRHAVSRILGPQAQRSLSSRTREGANASQPGSLVPLPKASKAAHSKHDGSRLPHRARLSHGGWSPIGGKPTQNWPAHMGRLRDARPDRRSERSVPHPG